ncbi:MAG: hypothetical protein UY72_C0013G0016 [Candidatus Uhrbacteria bacterium GW2011_GWD2_52_7]|uniref:Uncharacterized protein n=1 Tax=Candidatus Uhrbacteria bacterium GW2011_GWD2_52_7 TaxID=1618989 RepID=A0A0G1XHH3_9BACT|nr:MAG: hypothetical protein UY72_C0013G0016 [Candidatus Uhrbacteria bacterium GW2011_GWD2_52_7]
MGDEFVREGMAQTNLSRLVDTLVLDDYLEQPDVRLVTECRLRLRSIRSLKRGGRGMDGYFSPRWHTRFGCSFRVACCFSGRLVPTSATKCPSTHWKARKRSRGVSGCGKVIYTCENLRITARTMPWMLMSPLMIMGFMVLFAGCRRM